MWECRHQGNCDEGFVKEPQEEFDHGEAIGSFLATADAGSARDSDPDPEEFRTYKDDSNLRDQQSTGRKRAAKLYPLDPDGDCDWKMRKNCGGGTTPIVGCISGKQEARHHGPDKNTLNNEKGNVHRICHMCHNRWHTLNDEGYVWGAIYNPHNPLEASVADIGLNEVFWDGRKIVKAKD